MTFSTPRRVMIALSRGLLRFATLAGPVLALGVARPARAQIPAWVAPDPALSVVAPAAAPAPDVPARPATSPAPSEAPSPAKAVVITEQHAAPAAPVDDREAPPPRATWYGWQTLVADAATLSIFITAGVAGSRRGSDEIAGPLAGIGALGYAFAPAIVHFAHRHPGRGFASFGLRIGLPLAGIFLGASAASGCNGFLCEAGGASVGALVGVGGAIAIDAAVFAYDDPEPPRKRGVWLVPTLAVTRERALVGLAGAL